MCVFVRCSYHTPQQATTTAQRARVEQLELRVCNLNLMAKNVRAQVWWCVGMFARMFVEMAISCDDGETYTLRKDCVQVMQCSRSPALIVMSLLLKCYNVLVARIY